MPMTLAAGRSVWTSIHRFHTMTRNSRSVANIPSWVSSENQRTSAAGRREASTETSCCMSALIALPLLDGANQALDRRDTEHDDEIAGQAAVLQAEAGVDDEGVAEALAV